MATKAKVSDRSSASTSKAGGKPAARTASKASTAAARKPAAAKAAPKSAGAKKPAAAKKAATVKKVVAAKKPAAARKVVTGKSAPKKEAASRQTPAKKTSAIQRVAEKLARLVKPKAAPAKAAAKAKPAKATESKAPARPASRDTGNTRKAITAPAKAVPVTAAAPTQARKKMTQAAPQTAKGRTSKAMPLDVDTTAILPDRPDLPIGYRPKPGEEYMSPEQLEYFRQKLLKWRADLVEESQQTIDNLREEVRDVGDDAERATRETENSLELRTRDRYRKLISKIDKALKRIEEGDYGYCEETGEEIGLERLEARPIATLSFDAQERWEHRQKLMGD